MSCVSLSHQRVKSRKARSKDSTAQFHMTSLNALSSGKAWEKMWHTLMLNCRLEVSQTAAACTDFFFLLVHMRLCFIFHCCAAVFQTDKHTEKCVNTSWPFKSIRRFYSEAAATAPKYTFEFIVREKRKCQLFRWSIAKGEKQARKLRLPSVGLTLNKKNIRAKQIEFNC